MAVSGADKAFRDRQAMIGEISPIPQAYAFLRRSWEKCAAGAPFEGLFAAICGALHHGRRRRLVSTACRHRVDSVTMRA
jgi:flagellar motor component MotA